MAGIKSESVADFPRNTQRETNIKDICVELAKEGKIENTWGGGNRKPQDTSIIRASGDCG